MGGVPAGAGDDVAGPVMRWCWVGGGEGVEGQGHFYGLRNGMGGNRKELYHALFVTALII